jgi:predicted Zn-dependent peptidase
MTALRSFLLLGLAVLTGCAAEAPPPPVTGVAIPVRDTTPKPPPTREEPPASGVAKPYRFPKVVWAELPGGLRVATIPSQALPIVHVRVVVEAGRAADGERPGLAGLTAELLKDGGVGAMSSRELAMRIASLGADVSIETSFDSTTFGIAVTRDHLGEALDLLAAMVLRPQLSSAELDKLKRREVDRLADAAHSKGGWGATMMLYRDLFALPSEHHPYATWSATPEEVQKITSADCRAFHRRFYVPRNTFVIVAGDTLPGAATALATKAFAGFSGGEPPALSFTDPNPPEARKITIVDRPHSSQSEILVGALGPPRTDKSFAAFAVANQILGGGVSGRLFADVREKQSLAYSTRSTVTELAHGPSVLVASAGTQTAKTGLALQGLLEHTEGIGRTVPSAEEVETAQRHLADTFAIHLEATSALADELARLHTFGLPDDYDDGYRKELGEITQALALKAAADHLRAGHEIVVVAGDAAVVGPMLAHFGDVKVVDPTRGFARIRTIPMDVDAPLEVPRQAGK